MYGSNSDNEEDEDDVSDVQIDPVVELEDDAADNELMVFPPETVTELITFQQPETTEIDEDEDDDFSMLPKQMRCIAHSLNLVGTTDFDKNLRAAAPRCFNMFTSAFAKLKRFWCLNSRSSVAREIVERICKKSFPYPNATRWNSKFDAIVAAEKHKQSIKQSIEEINREISKTSRNKANKNLEVLTASEWEILKDYSTCMHPIAIALDILQGEDRACQGYVLPTLYEIHATLKENIDNDVYMSDYGNDMHDCVKDALKNRFGEMMEFDEKNEDLILAATIHPNFKLSWIEREQDREYAQGLVINKYIEESNSRKNDTVVRADSVNNTESSTMENQFFKHLRVNGRRNSNEDTLTFDIWKYLLQTIDDPNLDQVRQDPIIEHLFRRYNTTLSSSAAVERIFSKAILIFTNRRNRISDANFEKILFVRQNKGLWT